MRMMLLLLLFLLALPAVNAAEVYRCRDKSGTLVMTDDPSKFPQGCRPVEEDSGAKAGSLNILTSPDVPSPPGQSVEQAVREQQAETAQRETQSAAFREEARQIAQAYQQALEERNEAYNSWSYGSRKVVKEATETMEEAKKRKQELIREAQNAYLPGRVREEIRKLLDPVP